MPMPAANLLEAVAFTNIQVGSGNPLGFLLFHISTFNSLWAPSFDPNNTNDRPVRNWIVSSKVVEDETPTTGNAQQRQAVVDAAIRVLYAADAAFAAGRITTSQRDDVLAAWNSSFGALP